MLLADRYRFTTSVQSGSQTIAWLVQDNSSGLHYVASSLGPARLGSVEAARTVRHPHLATVVQVVTSPDKETIPAPLRERTLAVGIAEYIPGHTLHEELKVGVLTPREAVRCIARVARAARALHEAGSVHGGISPRSIVTSPGGGRTGPVLTQLFAPTSGEFSSRERLQKRGMSVADDAWGLHASLFAALTGVPPYVGSSREELVRNMVTGQIRRLRDFSIEEPELEAILDRGLVANPRWRASVQELCEALEAWETSLRQVEEEAIDSSWDDEDEMTRLMDSVPSQSRPSHPVPSVRPSQPMAQPSSSPSTPPVSPSRIPPPRPRQLTIPPVPIDDDFETIEGVVELEAEEPVETAAEAASRQTANEDETTSSVAAPDEAEAASRPSGTALAREEAREAKAEHSSLNGGSKRTSGGGKAVDRVPESAPQEPRAPSEPRPDREEPPPSSAPASSGPMPEVAGSFEDGAPAASQPGSVQVGTTDSSVVRVYQELVAPRRRRALFLAFIVVLAVLGWYWVRTFTS